MFRKTGVYGIPSRYQKEFKWYVDSNNQFSLPSVFGPATSVRFQSRKEGDSLRVRGSGVAGGPGAATAYISLPAGLHICIPKTPGVPATNGQSCGIFCDLPSSATTLANYVIWVDQLTPVTDRVFIAAAGSGADFTKENANSICAGANDAFCFDFIVPIAEWAND